MPESRDLQQIDSSKQIDSVGRIYFHG